MDRIGMFRGKKIDTGEWAYGFFIKSTDDRCFIGKNLYVHEKGNPSTLTPQFDAVEVVPETLAQYTTLNDKNDKPIYGSIEIDGKRTKGGDIAKINGNMFVNQRYATNSKHPNDKGYSLHKIEWKYCGFWLIGIDIMSENGEPSENSFCESWVRGGLADCYPFTIVGNQLDNPELLGDK